MHQKKVNSKAKGARGEREAVKMLKRLGFEARRTQQYNGKFGAGDIVSRSLPDIHFEVKYGYDKKDFDLGTEKLKQAMVQSYKDADIGTIPIVLWKPSGSRDWRLTYSNGVVALTVVGDDDIQATLSALTG